MLILIFAGALFIVTIGLRKIIRSVSKNPKTTRQQTEPITQRDLREPAQRLAQTYVISEHHDLHHSRHKTEIPPPQTDEQGALLIQIDMHGMTSTGIERLKSAAPAPRQGVSPTDARFLCRFVPRSTNLTSYALSCPLCGWCEVYTQQWVLEKNSFTCSRCAGRVELIKIFDLATNPKAIQSERARRDALALNPATFDRPWVASGKPTLIASKLKIQITFAYTSDPTQPAQQFVADVRSLYGYELADGFKPSIVYAVTANDPGRKFRILLMKELRAGPNGETIHEAERWFAQKAGLTFSEV